MKKLPKLLLAISLTGFAVGFFVTLSGFQFAPGWTVALPTGAIFFGLFLIVFMLQNEMAKFDEEQRANLAMAERGSKSNTKTASSHVEKLDGRRFTPAHAR